MMNLRLLKLLAISVFMTALATGCQNNLKVTVQRALVKPGLHLRHESRLGRRLDSAIRDLEEMKESCAGTCKAIDSWAERQSGRAASIKPFRDDVEKVRKDAATLSKECAAYFRAKDIYSEIYRARQTLQKVKRFLSADVETFRKTVISFEKGFSVKNRDYSSEQIAKDFKLLAKTASDVESHKYRSEDIGFGGFHSTDVFVINPSDPRYAEILRSGSPLRYVAPLAWENISVEPFSFAKTGVSGDSSVMIVMESPGQVRVYQVSNDPTQITRNIALLISKVTAAAAKYMSGGLAP